MPGFNVRTRDGVGRQRWAYRATIAFIFILCMVVVGHDLLRTWQDRSRQLESTRREAANLASAADKYAASAFWVANASLTALVERVEHDGTGPAQRERLHLVLEQRLKQSSVLQSMSVIDASGTLIVDGRPLTSQTDVSDRAYFRYHQTHADRGLHLGEVVQSRYSGKLVITASMRVDQPDGSFAGVAVASLALAYFQDFYASLDLGHDGAIALYRDDGILLVRQPFIASAVGAIGVIFPRFHDAVDKASVGTFEANSARDGVLRIYAYRWIAGFPLVVASALGMTEQLAVWRAGAAEHLFATAVAAALLGLISIRLVMQVQRLTRAEQATAVATATTVQRAADLVLVNAAMGRSEERFRRLVEAAPTALVMINAAGQIELVNAQTERLFGYTRLELLGGSVEMLLPVEMRGQHVGFRAGFFADPKTRPKEVGRALFGLHKDGSKLQVEIGLSPIETDEGPMVLSSIVDISDRVRLEAQLRQSQKMHAIGRVTAGVAHDFNNLLQILGSSLEFLLEAVTDNPEAGQWGQVALRATTRGRELTDRLLSFSRQQLLKPGPVAIDALFGDLKQLIGHLFETNTKGRTELVMMPCPAGLAVLADFAQLEAALINLAVNARDAMNFGGCLRISAYEADADPSIVLPGRYTVISVADTGSGMDADTLAQACEPFFTTKGLNGTGLGLSMVHGFARQSGGEAHITSVVGEGTTIDLWLPSASVSSAVAAPVMAPARASGHILVVDDSPDVLLVVSASLRGAGLEVTSKASGDLALAELAGGKRFDAIVTDFAMRGMNGLELLTLAREIDQRMMGMIITGFSDPEMLSNLDDVVVLRKPFNRAELVEKVRALVAAKRVVAGGGAGC